MDAGAAEIVFCVCEFLRDLVELGLEYDERLNRFEYG